MKMHEALHSLVMARGKSVLESDSLADLLDHEHVFDRCPALKEAFAAFVKRGYARDLYRSSLRGRFMYWAMTYRVRKAMAKESRYWQAFVDYSVASVSYALDSSRPIPTPFESGFSYSDGDFGGSVLAAFFIFFPMLPVTGSLIYTWQMRSEIDWTLLSADVLLGAAGVFLLWLLR